MTAFVHICALLSVVLYNTFECSYQHAVALCIAKHGASQPACIGKSDTLGLPSHWEGGPITCVDRSLLVWSVRKKTHCSGREDTLSVRGVDTLPCQGRHITIKGVDTRPYEGRHTVLGGWTPDPMRVLTNYPGG